MLVLHNFEGSKAAEHQPLNLNKTPGLRPPVRREKETDSVCETFFF